MFFMSIHFTSMSRHSAISHPHCASFELQSKSIPMQGSILLDAIYKDD
jgi:hypothetical protein